MAAPTRWPVRLCASFTEEQQERMKVAAEDRTTSISSVIRRAVTDWLDANDY